MEVYDWESKFSGLWLIYPAPLTFTQGLTIFLTLISLISLLLEYIEFTDYFNIFMVSNSSISYCSWD